MNPRARQSIPPIVTERLPGGWTPPSTLIDIGQLEIALPAPPRAPSLRFAADDEAQVWIQAVRS